MLRQYKPPRGRLVRLQAANITRNVMVGTIEVGAILRPNKDFPLPGRGPWIVEAWMNRTYSAHHKGPDGKWQDVQMLGGHIAQVRSLANRRHHAFLSDHHIRRLDDQGCVS